MSPSKGWVDFSYVVKNVPILDVMAHYGVELRQEGKGYRGACPIHANGKKGQFSVLPEKGIFRCFADCGTSGNVIKFVELKEKCPPRDAALLLTQWFGLVNPNPPKDITLLNRLEAIAKTRDVPPLVFARRLLEEAIAREESLLKKEYEETTQLLERVLTRIIQGDSHAEN